MKRHAAVGALAGIIGVLAASSLTYARGAIALTPDVEAAVLEALVGPEGEYAAHASYDAVLAKYGVVEPYTRIAAAELRHIAALQRLLDRYGVAYPRENPHLGAVVAPVDLAAAAQAWAGGEIANVVMYDKLLDAAEGYMDVTRVFHNLRSASHDAHLPAFEQAAANGGTIPAEPCCGGRQASQRPQSAQPASASRTPSQIACSVAGIRPM